MSEVFEKYDGKTIDKLNNFEKYVRRQPLARFLARYELFKLIKNVKGSIIECGVHHGGGLMAWAKLSSILEPYAIHRKVIGFDTFEGFPDVSGEDQGQYENSSLLKGGFDAGVETYNELIDLISEYDNNRFLNQIGKVKMIKGNAIETIPEFIQGNQHITVALLFLDFDLYEPTKVAMENFIDRIPKGGIIAFDEVNNEFWPGETQAILKTYKNLNNLELRKFEFDPNISYAVI